MKMTRCFVMHILLVQLFFIPLCLGHVAAHALPQLIEEESREEVSKRAVQPFLNIREGPKPVTQVKTGEKMFLECLAGGTPPPTIHWLKNGEKIQGLYDVKTEVIPSHLGIGITRSRLYFDCITEYHAAKYTCVADTEYFEESMTGLLLVSPGDNHAVCPSKINAAPHINMWSQSRLEMMGTDVQLFCRASGIPRPKVVWEGPEGNRLVDSPKYKILENGDLFIRDIQWNDMGSYMCRIKNFAGAEEVSIFLYPTLPDEAESENA